MFSIDRGKKSENTIFVFKRKIAINGNIMHALEINICSQQRRNEKKNRDHKMTQQFCLREREREREG